MEEHNDKPSFENNLHNNGGEQSNQNAQTPLPNPEPAPIFSTSESPAPAPAPTTTPAPAQQTLTHTDNGIVPVPVVRVLSPRGVEYVFLIIALFTSAIALGSILISLVNGQYGFSVLSYPVAGLVVALPVFALLFLRQKKAELNDPSLKLDASKRRSTQFTQIVSFVISFFTLIGFIGIIFANLGGSFKSSMVKTFLDVLVVEVIAGGILFYYWRDEHAKVGWK